MTTQAKVKTVAEKTALLLRCNGNTTPYGKAAATIPPAGQVAAVAAAQQSHIWTKELYDGKELLPFSGRRMRTPEEIQREAEERAMVVRGTKAWADVPDATAWVDELRGN